LSSVSCLRPAQLADLNEVFQRLELGQSVALQDPAASFPANSVTPGDGESPWLGVCSSGSTGQPKLIWRRWSDLLAEVRADGRSSGWTWASSFAAESFAGVQAALQAWRTQGSALSLSHDCSTAWKQLIENQPEALSCTPTFLDLLLQFEDHADHAHWTPKQITLGGEVLRTSSGERFARRFPSTRFTVVYAAAEHGVLLKTHRLDGWYESESLTRRSPAWRVQEGVLELCQHGEWVSTHDLVELQGSLLRVVGRAYGIANIGGAKVSLEEIGRLAEEVPGVRRAIAFVDPSPVVGQIVALKYSLEPGFDQVSVQARLELHLRERLRKEAWPRRWELDLVGVGRNSKRVRN